MYLSRQSRVHCMLSGVWFMYKLTAVLLPGYYEIQTSKQLVVQVCRLVFTRLSHCAGLEMAGSNIARCRLFFGHEGSAAARLGVMTKYTFFRDLVAPCVRVYVISFLGRCQQVSGEALRQACGQRLGTSLRIILFVSLTIQSVRCLVNEAVILC